jgi:hypothetical protein
VLWPLAVTSRGATSIHPPTTTETTMSTKTLAVTAIALFTGCASSYDMVKQRASFEFGCATDQIATTRLPGAAIGATGCGKQATYIWDRSSLSWARNSEIQTEVPAPTAQAAQQ